MRGRQLLRSQRLRCAVSTLNYFPNEVFSFPLNLDFSFRGRSVLRREDFVTPHPEVYGTSNRRDTYVHQVPLYYFWELLFSMKWRND